MAANPGKLDGFGQPPGELSEHGGNDPGQDIAASSLGHGRVASGVDGLYEAFRFRAQDRGGVGGPLAMGRLIAGTLYGLKAWDPATVTGSAMLLILVALAASWVPARRAAEVDPMRALRHD